MDAFLQAYEMKSVPFLGLAAVAAEELILLAPVFAPFSLALAKQRGLHEWYIVVFPLLLFVLLQVVVVVFPWSLMPKVRLLLWLVVGFSAGLLAGVLACTAAMLLDVDHRQRFFLGIETTGFFSMLIGQLFLSAGMGLSWLRGAVAGTTIALLSCQLGRVGQTTLRSVRRSE